MPAIEVVRLNQFTVFLPSAGLIAANIAKQSYFLACSKSLPVLGARWITAGIAKLPDLLNAFPCK